MTILLTGATGFIGRHVLSRLWARDDQVVSFGRAAPRVSEKHTRQHRHVLGDLATGAGLDGLPWAEFDQVIHLAAAGVKASRRAWPEALAVNVVGTQRLLAGLRASAAAPRIFIAKTFYEDLVNQAPACLENPYVATKRAATQLAQLFAETYSGGMAFGNFFQVYGAGDDPGNVLSYAALEFKAGRSPVFGSGQGLRDWIHVSDAASGVLACMDSAGGPPVQNFDIGSGELRSIRQMVETLQALCPESPKPIFDPSRDRPDIDIVAQARKLPPGWASTVPYQHGLARLLSPS